MKDYVLIFRHYPLTPEVMASVRPKWALIIPRWKELGYYTDSLMMTNDAFLLSGAERTLTNSPAAVNGQIVLSVVRIKVESMEKAVEIAKESPTLDIGGSVEVRAIHDLPPSPNNA